MRRTSATRRHQRQMVIGERRRPTPWATRLLTRGPAIGARRAPGAWPAGKVPCIGKLSKCRKHYSDFESSQESLRRSLLCRESACIKLSRTATIFQGTKCDISVMSHQWGHPLCLPARGPYRLLLLGAAIFQFQEGSLVGVAPLSPSAHSSIRKCSS